MWENILLSQHIPKTIRGDEHEVSFAHGHEIWSLWDLVPLRATNMELSCSSPLYHRNPPKKNYGRWIKGALGSVNNVKTIAGSWWLLHLEGQVSELASGCFKRMAARYPADSKSKSPRPRVGITWELATTANCRFRDTCFWCPCLYTVWSLVALCYCCHLQMCINICKWQHITISASSVDFSLPENTPERFEIYCIETGSAMSSILAKLPASTSDARWTS